MKPFLQTVADYLYENFPNGLDKVCIIFPNRRASLYLNKYLAIHMKSPVWAPVYSTISDLMSEISGLKCGDPLQLQYELYKAYAHIHSNCEPFEQFYSWGLTILSDFDDIDKYQVDASILFQNLSDLKEIDERFDFLSEEQKEVIRSFWGNVRLEKNVPLIQGFMNFWSELGEVYLLLKKRLLERKLAYEGMIYLDVAAKVKQANDIPLSFDHYCFVGFNALNECEKGLFDFFKHSGKASFFWDYDDYYVKNDWHEAGLFLRENIKRYPSPTWDQETNFFADENREIRIIAANNDVAQAKILPQLIHESGTNLNTCVVLSDEALLVPVLSSLPDSVSRVNITMGYPFSNSPAFSLLELLIKIFRSVRKDPEVGILYYHRDLRSLIQHPYIQQVYPLEVDNLILGINADNQVYIQPGQLEPIGLVFDLLQPGSMGILSRLSEFLLLLAGKLEEEGQTDALDIQYILSLYGQTNILGKLIDSEKIELSLNALLKFLRMVAQRVKVSFIGEPLTDFQILGVLETRLLDFDHVIMLSVNEGVLPAKETGNSFIPYNLRKAMGMPTIEYHDSIYAYYFYRFIQRARKVTLVYNAQTGGMRSGEMSRYLYQLKYDSKFSVTEQALTFKISIPSELPIMKEKSELMESFAKDHTFTPTSINTWLSCSLKFYYQFILGIREQEELSEDLDASQFGRLLHQIMFTLYHPWESKRIEKTDILALKDVDSLNAVIESAFEHIFPSKGKQTWKSSGRNLIIKEILLKYVLKILDVDEAYAPFEVVALEKFIEREMSIPGFSIPFKIGGYVDRIDSKAGIYRIIDYKTGEAIPNFNDLSELFRAEKRKQKDAALQCIIYAYVLMDSEIDGNIQAGLYSVKKMFDKGYNFKLRITKGQDINDIREFKDTIAMELEAVFHNLFDKNISFSKTTDLKACLNCPYKDICHR